METEQEKLEKGIGTTEAEVLKPAKVRVENVRLEVVRFGNKTNEKLVLSCKHPDREEPISISKAKVLIKDKVRISGIWYSTDSEGLIQKGSTIAELLNYAKVSTPKELTEKEFETITDDDGYLVIKAY